MSEKTKLLMVTAVWGEWHLNAHLSVNLPTLLAPGNLPALTRHCDLRYLIFTRAEDEARIQQAPEIAALRELIPIKIKLLSAADIADPIAGHHKAWARALRRAVRNGSLLLLMPPDVAWADNSFATVGRRFDEGHRAIFMTYLRVECDSFIASIQERRGKALTLSVPPREMVRLSLDCLHPLMAAYLHDSDFFPIHPEMILWAVPGEGLAVRILAREMFLFDPARYPVNHAALPSLPMRPEEMCFLTDSDQFYAVSLAPLGKDSAWHLLPRTVDPVEVGGWWLTYDSPVNNLIAAQKVRWHFEPVSDQWRRIERRADRFVHAATAAREGIRLWQAARRLGCSSVASVLALAVHTGVFARATRGRGAALVFLPVNTALVEMHLRTLEALLTPAKAGQLGRLLRAHFVPEAPTDAEDPLGTLFDGQGAGGSGGREIVTANGRHKLQRSVNGSYSVGAAQVLSGPLKIGTLAVYTVDRLLAVPDLGPEDEIQEHERDQRTFEQLRALVEQRDAADLLAGPAP